MHPIFGVVGPSGSGKSTLIQSALDAFPTQLGIVKSLTTRAKRNAEDELFYDFVSIEEIRKREQEGRLIQISSYADNLYGNDRLVVDDLLNNKFGIMAIVQEGIVNFRKAGYELILIDIVPEQETRPKWVDASRTNADQERFQIPMEFACTIHNSFAQGGKEKAVLDFIRFLETQGLIKETSVSS